MIPQRKPRPRKGGDGKHVKLARNGPTATATATATTAAAAPTKRQVGGFDYEAWAGASRGGMVRCTHNPTHIIDLADVAISVADGVGAWRAERGSVVLNCLGDARHAPVEMPDGFGALAGHLPAPRVREITLPWPDGGIPPVLPSFWRALIEACAAEKAPLLIHCIGGHGRTGTALAAILIAYSISAPDAVAFVRKNHCDRAIETQAQIDYLAELDLIINENWDSP